MMVTAVVAASAGFFGARWTATTSATQPTTQPEDDSPPIAVATVAMRRDELAESSSAFGVVQTRPGDAVAISVPFESIPTVVHVVVGQPVPAGAVLIDLQPSPDARLQLRQAEQALAAAQQTADQARRRRDAQLATNADVIAADQARDTAQTQFDAQRARGTGTARTLTAATAGLVSAVAAQPGQVVAAGAPLVVVSPEDSVEVRLGVDPADADALKVGDAIRIQPPNTTNTLAGKVDHQNRVLNPQRMCDVFVRLNAAGGLRPGTFVEGRFTRRLTNGLIVPRAATQLEDDQWCVYTVTSGKATRHVVTLGPSDGHDVIVTGEGLAGGDAVVVERDGQLQDGASVKAESPDEDEK